MLRLTVIFVGTNQFENSDKISKCLKMQNFSARIQIKMENPNSTILIRVSKLEIKSGMKTSVPESFVAKVFKRLREKF